MSKFKVGDFVKSISRDFSGQIFYVNQIGDSFYYRFTFEGYVYSEHDLVEANKVELKYGDWACCKNLGIYGMIDHIWLAGFYDSIYRICIPGDENNYSVFITRNDIEKIASPKYSVGAYFQTTEYTVKSRQYNIRKHEWEYKLTKNNFVFEWLNEKEIASLIMTQPPKKTFEKGEWVRIKDTKQVEQIMVVSHDRYGEPIYAVSSCGSSYLGSSELQKIPQPKFKVDDKVDYNGVFNHNKIKNIKWEYFQASFMYEIGNVWYLESSLSLFKSVEKISNSYYYDGKEIWDTTKVDTSVLLEALTMERKEEEKYFGKYKY